MTGKVQIIPANAGAGKTYYITQTLTAWIADGTVRPERILAVTYTEAAASELRERIRHALLEQDRIQDALALGTAYISTIHGFGQRILTEHAFAAGGSPSPRLIEDTERDFLIRRALANCPEIDPILSDLERYGFRYDTRFGSAEDQLRNAVIATINQLLALGDKGKRPQIAVDSVARFKDMYGSVSEDPSPLEATLKASVAAMLDTFPDGIADRFEKKAPQEEFRNNYALLKRANETDDLSRDWRLWKGLRGLRQSKRGSATPDGYDDLAAAIMAAADGIISHPTPRDDAAFLLRSLISTSQTVIENYADLKRRIGVVDYSDMVAGAEKLIRENSEVLDTILSEIDCVVIDEFQDTNPVQFAFLWAIAQRAERSVLVGDVKQSIMGFQGADMRLTQALTEQNPKAVHHLPFNWRSTAGLVEFFNAFSQTTFGSSYHSSAPQRAQPDGTYLEILHCPNSRNSRGEKTRPYHNSAMRIASILEDGEQIIDRVSKTPRDARAEDIAILCRSHGQMMRYANALRALDIKVQITTGGWFSSPAVQLACHALRFSANPNDSYAALGWLTLGPEGMSIQAAVEQLTEGTLCTNQALKTLAALGETLAGRSMSEFTNAVLEQSNLNNWVKTQPNPSQLRADLLRLAHEANLFDEMEADLLATEGFYGASPEVFTGWLESREDRRDNDRRPDPSGASGEGVVLTTWFSAKGREWPIVLVAQLDDKFASRAGQVKAGFTDFYDLSNVLDNAYLDWFPALDIAEKSEKFAAHNRPDDEENAKRQLYVALTRARDRLVLEWPAAAVGKTSAGENRNFVDFLMDIAKIEIDGASVRLNAQEFPSKSTQGEDVCPAIFTDPPEIEWPDFLDIAPASAPLPHGLTPWRGQPSSAQGIMPSLALADHKFGPAVSGITMASATERGTAVHLVLRAALAGQNNADSLAESSGLKLRKTRELVEQARALQDWLSARGYDSLRLELPMQEIAATGAETNAIVDCLAESEDGFLIVDHKTGPATDTAKRFTQYWPQLSAYKELVAQIFPSKPVLGLAINWVDLGVVTVCEFDPIPALA